MWVLIELDGSNREVITNAAAVRPGSEFRENTLGHSKAEKHVLIWGSRPEEETRRQDMKIERTVGRRLVLTGELCG